MAACPGETCEGFDGSGAVWFKIAQYGLEANAPNLEGPWKQWLMIGNVNNEPQSSTGFTVTIPKNLKAGNYLIRHEVIMLASGKDLGAQFYPECAQLTVTGGGDAFPSDEYLVSFPGAYDPSGKCCFCVWHVCKNADENLRSWYCSRRLGNPDDSSCPYL